MSMSKKFNDSSSAYSMSSIRMIQSFWKHFLVRFIKSFWSIIRFSDSIIVLYCSVIGKRTLKTSFNTQRYSGQRMLFNKRINLSSRSFDVDVDENFKGKENIRWNRVYGFCSGKVFSYFFLSFSFFFFFTYYSFFLSFLKDLLSMQRGKFHGQPACPLKQGKRNSMGRHSVCLMPFRLTS